MTDTTQGNGAHPPGHGCACSECFIERAEREPPRSTAREVVDGYMGEHTHDRPQHDPGHGGPEPDDDLETRTMVRAIELASIVSDQIWGGECGWEIANHDQFTHLKSEVRRRLRGMNIALHEVADAFWECWKENGATDKHGLYEATWMSLRAALKVARANGGPPDWQIARDAADATRALKREVDQELDNWAHRSAGMKCATCMWYVHKGADLVQSPEDGAIERLRVGRCRRRAPTLNGFPVMYATDWCGDHKIDEEKI